MIDNAQIQRDQQEKIRLGQIVREGLESPFWLEILKPIIDSMIKGLDSISDLKKTQISSSKKADILIEGRAQAIDYISEIETLAKGFIIDADTILDINEKQRKSIPLFKTVD